MEAKVENAVNQVEDLRFELEKSISHEVKLENQIIEVHLAVIAIRIMLLDEEERTTSCAGRRRS